MKILPKGGICIICRKSIVKPNVWVRFHIRYKPKEICIIACKYCNFAEFALRTSNFDGVGRQTKKRIPLVIKFFRKFDIQFDEETSKENQLLFKR